MKIRILSLTLIIYLLTSIAFGQAFTRLDATTADPKGNTVLDNCGDFPNATAMLDVQQMHTSSEISITISDAMPNMLYTAWLRLQGNDLQGNKFGGSPFTGAGSTPLAPSTALPDLLAATGAGNGTVDVANGVMTDASGNGVLSVSADFLFHGGVYPFNNFADFDASDERFPIDNPMAIPVAIVMPSENISAPFGIRIASHCTDGLGHGLTAGAREPWFDLKSGSVMASTAMTSTTMTSTTMAGEANIVKRVAKAAIDPSGDVQGKILDIVIALDIPMDPSIPGRSLKAGKTIRVVLPSEVIETESLPFGTPISCPPAPAKCNTVAMVQGWPQKPIPFPKFDISFEAPSTIIITAKADIGPSEAGPGIKVIHLFSKGFTNPPAGQYNIEVIAETGPDGAIEKGTGVYTVLAEDRPNIQTTSVFSAKPGTNLIFQETAVGTQSPLPLDLLLWDGSAQPMNGVTISSDGTQLLQNGNAVGSINWNVPTGSQGYRVYTKEASTERPAPLSGIAVSHLIAYSVAGDLPGTYSVTFSLDDGTSQTMHLTATEMSVEEGLARAYIAARNNYTVNPSIMADDIEIIELGDPMSVEDVESWLRYAEAIGLEWFVESCETNSEATSTSVDCSFSMENKISIALGYGQIPGGVFQFSITDEKISNVNLDVDLEFFGPNVFSMMIAFIRANHVQDFDTIFTERGTTGVSDEGIALWKSHADEFMEVMGAANANATTTASEQVGFDFLEARGNWDADAIFALMSDELESYDLQGASSLEDYKDAMAYYEALNWHWTAKNCDDIGQSGDVTKILCVAELSNDLTQGLGNGSYNMGWGLEVQNSKIIGIYPEWNRFFVDNNLGPFRGYLLKNHNTDLQKIYSQSSQFLPRGEEALDLLKTYVAEFLAAQ